MWRVLRRLSTLQTRSLPAVKSLRFLTNLQLIELAKQMTAAPTDPTAARVFEPYCHVLTTRTARMTTQELLQLAKVSVQNDLFNPVLASIVKALAVNAHELVYEDCVELARSVGTKAKVVPGAMELLGNVSRGLTEVEESELLAKPLSSFAVILKTFSNVQVGDADFYKSIADILLVPMRLDSISTMQLLRFCVYLRRVHKTAGRGGFGLYGALEKRLWDDIHHKRYTDLPALLRIFGELIPAGLGSNKLQLLVEYSLFQQLSKPENRITTTQLVELMQSASNYLFKYKPLFVILQQLINDSMTKLSLKDAIGVFWALGKNNKDCPGLLNALLANINGRLETEKCPLRSFTFLLNGCLNAGKTDLELMQALTRRLRTFEMKAGDCHYWVKSLCILSAAGLHDDSLLKSVLALVDDARNTVKGADIVRVMCASVANPALLSQHLSEFESLLKPQLKTLATAQLARLAYASATHSMTSPSFLTHVEAELQTRDLMALKPSDLAAAAFALADARRSAFVLHCVPALRHFLDVLRERVVELGSDSEEETGEAVQEEEIKFGTKWELTAAALVQICWTLAAADIKEPGFWSEKLVASLKKVRISENEFEINHWKMTAMAILGREEFFGTVDLRHYSMLLNTLALTKGVEEAQEVLAQSAPILQNFSEPAEQRASPDFLREVSAFCEANIGPVREGERDSLLNTMDLLLPNQVCVLCYSPHQTASGRLRATLEVKHRVLSLQGYTVKPVLESEWEGRAGPARRRLLAIG